MDIFPSIPQIYFTEKYSVESIDFTEKLSAYISNYYQENPNNYINDFRQLNDLREVKQKNSSALLKFDIVTNFTVFSLSLR